MDFRSPKQSPLIELMGTLSQKVEEFLRVFGLTKVSEDMINKEAISLLDRNIYVSSDSLASNSCKLICAIYEWGFYPNGLISHIVGLKKIRSSMEEISDFKLVERLCRSILKLIDQSPSVIKTGCCFKLLGLLRLQSLKDQPLVTDLVKVTTKYLGLYIYIDKSIYIISTKLLLKSSESIKQHKWLLGDKSCNTIRLIFQRFCQYSFLSKKEFLQVYVYYLKLLVSLGKDLALTSNWPQLPHQHLFIKILVMNLLISDKQDENNYNFSKDNARYMELVQSEHFRVSVPKMSSTEMSDYSQKKNWRDIEKIDSLNDPYLRDDDPVKEIIERIKINSIKLILVFVRGGHQSLLDTDLSEYLLPSSLMCFKHSEIIDNPYFYPCFLPGSYWRSAESKSFAGNTLVEAAVELLGSCSPDKLAYELKAVNKRILRLIDEQEVSGFSIIYSLLKEDNPEIKSMLMECSCVAHGVLLRKLTKKGFVTSLQAEEQRLSSLIKVKYYAANLITLHCLELFRSSSNYSHKIFAGLGGTFTSSILTHAPNALVKKMIMLVFVPTIISDQSDADEYLQVFEKFIDAAFDSGFSEYFLSNLSFLKQILLSNLRSFRSHSSNGYLSLARVSVILRFYSRLIENFPLEMADILCPIIRFCNLFFLDEKKLPALNHWSPYFLAQAIEVMDSISEYWSECGLFSLDDSIIALRDRRQIGRVTKDDGAKETICLASEYQCISRHVQQSIYDLLHYCLYNNLSEKFEMLFIRFICSIKTMQMRCLIQELFMQRGVSLEDAISELLSKIKVKKSKLDLLAYIISRPSLGFTHLMDKIWIHFFELYNEKVLTVEVICANYNIIFGLKNFSQLASESILLRIFRHTVDSMISKNRKLINNCIKIFGCLLAYYPSSLVSKILDMELPNVFYDEMTEDNAAAANDHIQGAEYFKTVFSFFMKHKYNRYSTRVIIILHEMLLSAAGRQNPEQNRLLAIVDHCLSSLIERMMAFENYTFCSTAMRLILEPEMIKFVPAGHIKSLVEYALSALCLESQPDNSNLEESKSLLNIKKRTLAFICAIDSLAKKFKDRDSVIMIENAILENTHNLLENTEVSVYEEKPQMAYQDGGFPGSSLSIIQPSFDNRQQIAAFISKLLAVALKRQGNVIGSNSSATVKHLERLFDIVDRRAKHAAIDSRSINNYL